MNGWLMIIIHSDYSAEGKIEPYNFSESESAR